MNYNNFYRGPPSIRELQNPSYTAGHHFQSFPNQRVGSAIRQPGHHEMHGGPRQGPTGRCGQVPRAYPWPRHQAQTPLYVADNTAQYYNQGQAFLNMPFADNVHVEEVDSDSNRRNSNSTVVAPSADVCPVGSSTRNVTVPQCVLDRILNLLDQQGINANTLTPRPQPRRRDQRRRRRRAYRPRRRHDVAPIDDTSPDDSSDTDSDSTASQTTSSSDSNPNSNDAKQGEQIVKMLPYVLGGALFGGLVVYYFTRPSHRSHIHTAVTGVDAVGTAITS